MFIFALFLIRLSAQTVPYPDNIYGGSSNGIVGKIADEFDITPAGQVSYEIPLSVMTGTGGMEPRLSITYSSAYRNGLFGSGFDLSGLSLINRAPSNLHTDGKAGYVNFTSSDKFMLDGQRLIFLKSVNSSTHEYRTENNSFAKILAYGSDKGNPSAFTMYTKSGLIYEYVANTSQLKTMATAADHIVFWLLRKVSDTKGNYYTISYDRDDTNGEYWPIRIDYTGNDNASLAPYNSVRFQYQINSYPSDSYIYGVKVRNSRIISRIDIYSGTKLMKYYTMSYQTVNQKRQLLSVTEYASDGTKLNPTKFTWHNSSDFKTTNVNYNTSSYITKANLTVGDYNGDGKADFLVTPKPGADWTGWRLFLSVGSSFTYAGSGSLTTGELQEVVSGDFNGDGYDDFVIKRKYNNKYYNSDLYLASGSGNSITFAYSKNIISDTRNYSIRTIEVSGDGIADLFLWFYNTKECKIVRSETSGTAVYPLNYTATRYCAVNWDRVEYVDFNGDGLTDIMNLNADGYHLLESDGYGTMSETRQATWPDKEHHLYFGDFNGDGKSDMLLTGWNKDPNSGGWSEWNVQLSTGVGFERKDFTKKFNSKDKVIYVADVNGDGKDDFYAVDKTAGSGLSPVYSYLNDGTGGYFQQTSGASTYGLDKWLYYLGDFNGDGKTDFLCTANFSNVTWTGCQLFQVPEIVNNLLATITDGLGNVTEISYKPMSNSAIHQRGTTKTYPLTSFGANWYLVEKVTTPNGIGGKNTTSYKYQNALVHKRGRGVLGFEYFTSKDETNNIETKIQTEVNTEQYVPAQKSVEIKASGKLISQTTVTNQLAYQNTGYYSKVFTFYPTASTEKKYEFNTNTLISQVETTTTYDGYGNVTQSATQNGSDVITNTNEYTNDETKWFLGRLTKATVEKRNSTKTITRVSKFEYDPASGLLNKEIVEPDDADLGYAKSYVHDPFGNITESKTKPNNTAYAERVLKTEYDLKGRFEMKLTNALGHFSQNDVDQDLGVVNYTLDANNIRTDFSYDKFGQLLVTTTPLGYVQKVKRWSNGIAGAPANAVYFTYTESTGNPPETEFFDQMGRSLRKIVPGFNGQNIYVDVIYNARGQVEKTSEPYFAGQTVYWNKNDYDLVSRPVKQTYADDSYYTFQYSGLTTITTDPLGQKDTRKKDTNGNLVESTDNKNGSVKYEYNISGNCTKVTGPRTAIVMEYDKYDRQIKLIDPDLGTVEYGYNAYGELVSQNDAHGTVTFTYDKLGRITDEIRSDVTITNTYDTKWKGALSQSVANNNISQDYSFDSYGRITETTENIQGEAYVTQTSYNADNKVDVITYPKGFKVKHEYTATGYLSKVLDALTGKTYWQANTVNARGQLENFTLGNSLSTTISHNPQKGYITGMVTPGIQNFTYTFNTVGNLTDRIDNLKSLTEHFDYDGLNRLWKVSHNGALQQETGYDAAGNITSKTGVGSFAYEAGTNRLKIAIKRGQSPNLFEPLPSVSNLREAKWYQETGIPQPTGIR